MDLNKIHYRTWKDQRWVPLCNMPLENPDLVTPDEFVETGMRYRCGNCDARMNKLVQLLGLKIGEKPVGGWQTIKEVRAELSEAKSLAEQGSKSTAYACMLYAKSLLERYCRAERGPDYGF